ncbi:uncharacterized protein LOC110704725 [Chenopodium quinoa]|uniref:uncharacterized protein LOC110704725 n=1 Tax=Chenopodium quinoa TaxID=63459 RepID=UPI000B7982A2|nr:uncharacterized protein LOC110704725 [Chenopodium quinoa]
MPYPIAHFVNCDRFSMGHRSFLAAITAGDEPQSFKEAMKDPGWREAMQKEIPALKDNGTRCWLAKLSSALKKYGFRRQSYSDYSLFSLHTSNTQINVLVYVNDLIISGNNSAALIITVKKYLSEYFHIKDLGVLKYFLGIDVTRNEEGIFLCRRKYTLDIISETSLLGGKPTIFPMEQHHQLAWSTRPFLTNVEKYKHLFGHLIYLSFTRPDLAYSVHILYQFLHEPRCDHWEAGLRVVRYVKGCPGQGILLHANCDLTLSGWCDSDWASCLLIRRALSDWLVFFRAFSNFLED